MNDHELLKLLKSMRDTLNSMDEHYSKDMEKKLEWVIESTSDAIYELDTLIEYDAESKEAQKNYNEMIIEQNAINMGMNRL